MNVQVELYGQLKEEIGTNSVYLNLSSDSTVKDLLNELKKLHPNCHFTRAEEVMDLYLLFVGSRIASLETVFCEGEKLVIFPFVTGG